MLLLGLAATVPGVSVGAGLLLMIPACQLILGHTTPVFPRRIAVHPIPTRHLAALVQRAVVRSEADRTAIAVNCLVKDAQRDQRQTPAVAGRCTITRNCCGRASKPLSVLP